MNSEGSIHGNTQREDIVDHNKEEGLFDTSSSDTEEISDYCSETDISESEDEIEKQNYVQNSLPSSFRLKAEEASPIETVVLSVEKLKGYQVKHAGFVFNRKEILKNGGVTVYCCRGYRRFKCSCQLSYCPSTKEWTSCSSHEHPGCISAKASRLQFLRDSTNYTEMKLI